MEWHTIHTIYAENLRVKTVTHELDRSQNLNTTVTHELDRSQNLNTTVTHGHDMSQNLNTTVKHEHMSQNLKTSILSSQFTHRQHEDEEVKTCPCSSSNSSSSRSSRQHGAVPISRVCNPDWLLFGVD
ncbi:hypothetical protein PoB_000159300 [Plakobranchus ocellatus]|uniref:Uncharacterized protein n=1 Tax=Plakobranchus ocellatus TaxID=259542 RepID=A0AAV3XXW0_9GAST|nr:hypothetical protein PoB_000159300 [Plakobranchus ocellatus]